MSPYASPNDHRQYHFMELPNRLKVLLICDPATDKSAAALAVNTGHFDDPTDRQGMAHFLEHMLFLGTQTYPKPGEYQQFMSRHGGSNNAWTGTEFTNFFFDIDNGFFEAGLDRFSQFFICPTFDPQWVDKERNAVDSEYRLKLKDDVRRSYQVHKETVNPVHPFAKFSVGNLDTLADLPSRDLRADLIEFYERHYSADRMALVLLSPATIEMQIQWCERFFAPIVNRHLGTPTLTAPLYRLDDIGIRIHINPVKESRKLALTFPLPNVDAHYDTKPLTFISHLIGYEGDGSLLALLKQKGWVNQLSAGGGISGANFKDFTINFGLTPQGLTHVDDIVAALFGYLKLIAREGIQDWRYQEKRQVLESAFRFQERGRALDTVSGLVLNLFSYASEDLLYGDYMMREYDEPLIRQFLAKLTPHNLRLTLIAPELSTDRLARWYQTPYSTAVITEAEKIRWQQHQPDPTLCLPQPNPFISTRLDHRMPATLASTPHRLIDRPGFRLWHLQEHQFNVPKGNLYISIDSEHAVKSPRNIAMARLAVELLADHLNAITYPAELAGLGYQFYAHQGGFTINLSGFADKQALLLEMILNNRTLGYPDPARFIEIKEQLIRNWENQAKARPIAQLFSLLTSLLQPNNPPFELLLQHLRTVRLEEMPAFVAQLFSDVHVEALVHGDWTPPEALALAALLERPLDETSQPSEETKRPLISIQGQGTLICERECHHEDSALLVYYQSPTTDARDLACFTLANHIMSSTFFHELRTRQQLGYVVGAGNLPLNRHPGLIFYIQSPIAGPQILLDAIEEFIDLFPLAMLELTEQQWQDSKAGLQAQLNERDANLRSRGQRLWVCIGNKDLTFDQRERVSQQVGQLSRADLVRFITQLRSRTSDRLILCSYGQGHGHDERISGHLIADPLVFRVGATTFDD
ncbi:insulinase family protein [Aeromonas cavernicola]|uniref:Protease 3 n=1 Tax=Aeromonas cavernicola TaxID=1006623 RepID=A0A2H9U4U7_9GAMM|nr:insulinase family protein [Aeromonas cavernicola]PJG58998.1 peptidase M16 [Aeromonas cavernicola]